MDQNGNILGEAHLTAISPQLTDYTPPVSPQTGGFTGTVFYQLTLDNAAPAAVSSMLWDTNANGQGFIITGTTIRNNRARGMLIKADEGQILDSTIDGTSLHGLLIDAEFPGVAEAGFVQNLVVQGNTFENIGRTSGYYGISLSGQSGKSHQGIQFLSNTFKNNYNIDLLVSSAETVAVTGNTFSGKTAAQQALLGSSFAQLPVIELKNTSGVALTGNTFPSGQISIGQGSGVTNISGEPTTAVP